MEPADHIAIAQLLARYTHIVDDAAWDRLGEIFTADGSMTVVGVHETHTGPEALRELYAVKMNHPIAHHSTSLDVLGEGPGTARTVSKWVTVRADGTAGTGVYRDELVHTADGWRIRARVATPARR